jgi:hypothetical protein
MAIPCEYTAMTDERLAGSATLLPSLVNCLFLQAKESNESVSLFRFTFLDVRIS